MPADAAPPAEPAWRARVRALLERLDAPEVQADPAQQKALLAEATALVDRAANPKLWAYLRHLTGVRSELDAPAEALAAHADALTAFGPDDEDRTVWLLSEGGIGSVLARTESPGTPGGERAIAHLERVAEAAPQWYAELLAALYGWRTAGDPVANWERQTALLALAADAAEPGGATATRIANARAAAEAARPGVDFGLANERRIEGHRRALAAAAPESVAHTETALELATAWLDRVDGDRAANLGEAVALLVPALDASVARGDRVREARAALLLGRVCAFGGPDGARALGGSSPDGARAASGGSGEPQPVARADGGTEADAGSLAAALAWIARGRTAAQDAGEPMLVASADRATALARLALLRQGDGASLAPAVEAARAAAAAFAASPPHADGVRTLRQIEADAWIAADRPAEAVAPLADAVRRVHADLARATSRAGRLELGWRVRDSAALLAWCHARAGDAQRACEALETGRGLLWSGGAADGAAAWSGDWTRLVPPGGAVAVPTFAGATGMAVVATRGADGAAVLDVVALPEAGAAALRALVSGAEPEVRLGGWLEAWCHRTSAPERFDDAVAHAAAELHRRVAAPVVACLDARGIAVGAELVWVPQGASSVLPLQAAAPAAGGPGLLDRVALRFAPSLAALERIARAESVGAAAAGPPLAVVDPTGDLPFAPLEALWLAEAEPALEVLRGEDATVARVLERLAPPPALLHVAGHGAFDLDDPFASALLLAGGARLTLDALLPRLAARGAPALVVLSACETSVVRATAHADELLGFPAALLAHGVRGAVGSLWPVADAQTALLMRVFHARRRAEGGAAALRAAQRWLRDARRSDVVAVLAPLRDRPAPIGPLVAAALAELAAADDVAPPFAHPVHWAGFALWGRA